MSDRITQLASLTQSIDSSTDPKAIADLQARINAEQGFIANEQAKLNVIAQLRTERDKIAGQLHALENAIRALTGLNSTRGRTRGRRSMSAAARAKIAASQRARWAKVKGQKGVSIAPKRRISAAGLARIRAAQRARWAKVRAKQ